MLCFENIVITQTRESEYLRRSEITFNDILVCCTKAPRTDLRILSNKVFRSITELRSSEIPLIANISTLRIGNRNMERIVDTSLVAGDEVIINARWHTRSRETVRLYDGEKSCNGQPKANLVLKMMPQRRMVRGFGCY